MKIKMQEAKDNQEPRVKLGAEEINSAQLNIKKRNRLILQKGVSLLTVLVAVVILIILAGVTLNLTMGGNGLFKSAKEAEEKHKISAYTEKIQLARGNTRNEQFRTSYFR